MSVQGKRYRCIIADCPWRYGGTDQFQPGADDAFRAARHRYPTMRTEDICALDVGALAVEDCVLLMWATLPLLPDALAVVAAWGFTYKSAIPWIKVVDEPRRTLWGDVQFTPQYGVGFWARCCAELLLVCVRGNPKPPPGAASSIGLFSPNYGHSRKPENAYEYAEFFPGPWLELFGRRTRAGWVTLGDGVEDLDIRESINRLSGRQCASAMTETNDGQ